MSEYLYPYSLISSVCLGQNFLNINAAVSTFPQKTNYISEFFKQYIEHQILYLVRAIAYLTPTLITFFFHRVTFSIHVSLSQDSSHIL